MPSRAHWREKLRDVQEKSTAKAAMCQNWHFGIGRRGGRRGVVGAGVVGVDVVALETRVGNEGLACGVGADNIVGDGIDEVVLRFQVLRTGSRGSSSQGRASATWAQAVEVPFALASEDLRSVVALWLLFAVL